MATKMEGTRRGAKRRHRRTVLVVEDDAFVCEAGREVLEDAGYAVAEERDGEPALRVLRRVPEPLVVLLNMHMPHLDGLGMLRAVGDDPALAAKSHAYVLMTASTAVERPQVRALPGRLGVPVLPKPFAVDALLAAVERAAAHLPDGEDAGRR